MREIARLLLPSVRWDPVHGFASARPAVERSLAAGVGGFVLEGGDPDAIGELTADIRRRADEAPLIAIAPSTLGASEPGDAVAVLPPAALASLRDPLLVRRAARAVACELRRIGCNAMLAPSCDVTLSPRGDAFGDDPASVASAVAEWVDASQAEGVLCWAGDFPGGGRISGGVGARSGANEIPVVDDGDDALYAADLVPFRAAIDAGVAGLLISPAIYRALDPETPAPLSHRILSRLLRTQLGFEGLTIVDVAVLESRRGRPVPAAELIAAGVDLIARATRVDFELRALLDAVRDGRLDRERVHDAARRCRERAERAGGPAASQGPDDRAWLDDVAERTITVVRGRSVRVGTPVDVAVVSDSTPPDDEGWVAAFGAGVGEGGADSAGVRRIDAPSRAGRTTVVVLLVAPDDPRRNAGVPRIRPANRAAALCAEARQAGRDSAVVWCGPPSSAPSVPGADLLIACWAPSATMLRAAGRWLVRRV